MSDTFLTAEERHEQWVAAGRPVGDGAHPWWMFCAVPDFCRNPCTDCAREGRIAREHATNASQ